jgi:hypothetical protein
MKNICLLLSLVFAFYSPISSQDDLPKSSDVNSLDGIIKAYYDVVSGPEGPKQIARDKSLHHPDANVMISGKDDMGKPYLRSITLDEYHTSASPAAFYEYEISRRTQTFGNITHVWSTYCYTFSPNGKIEGRGINSIQLYFDGDRYWILGWMYDSERPDNIIPKRYLP